MFIPRISNYEDSADHVDILGDCILTSDRYHVYTKIKSMSQNKWISLLREYNG